MDGWNIAKAEFERLGETVPLYMWDITINRRLKTTGGRAHFGKNQVEVAGWLVEKGSEADIKDVVRHEVAHVLAGADANHGPDWKAACKLTGARPKRCHGLSNLVETREFKWEVYCQRCHTVVGKRKNRAKRTRTYTHNRCGGTVVWQPIGTHDKLSMT